MATLFEGDFAGISPNGFQFLQDLALELASIKTQFNQLLTDHNAHVHGGVTAGGANSAAPTASTSTPLAVPDTVTDPGLQ